MKTIATALAAMLAIHAQAVQLTDEPSCTVLRIEEEDEQSKLELVEAAVPLIKCVLEDIEDDTTVKQIVSDILDKATGDSDDEDQDADADEDE